MKGISIGQSYCLSHPVRLREVRAVIPGKIEFEPVTGPSVTRISHTNFHAGPPGVMDLTRLRQETASEHARTEETVPLMRSTLTRAEYVSVLRRFFTAVSAWDHWSDAHVPPDLAPLLAGRRRAGLLVEDLRVLGQAEPVVDDLMLHRMEESAVPGDARSVFLGRMYVMEGSTLGGQYIAKHVEETLGLLHGEGDSYFVGYGDQTSARWQQFRAVLGAVSDAETETVIASAKNMFDLFGECMRADIATVPNSSDSEYLAGMEVDSGAKESIRN